MYSKYVAYGGSLMYSMYLAYRGSLIYSMYVAYGGSLCTVYMLPMEGAYVQYICCL